MKKLLYATLLVSIISLDSFSQNKYTFTQRANLRLGAQYSFQNGSGFDSIFQTRKASVQGTAFLGYRFDPKNAGANYFGLFATVGSISKNSILQMKQSQVLLLPQSYASEAGSVIELEAGFIFGDWFRISGGPGFLSVPLTAGKQSYKYYSATSGIIIKAGSFNLNGTTGVQFGGNFLKPCFRVGLGAGFTFNFLNARKKY